MRLVNIEYAAFTNPYDINIDRDDDDFVSYKAELENGMLGVIFSENYKGLWEIMFGTNKQLTNRDRIAQLQYDATGTGNAARIFATVLVAIKKFTKEHNDYRILNFSAKGASRVRLYSRLAAMGTKTLGLSLITTTNRYKNTEFILYKPEHRKMAELYAEEVLQ